MSYKSWAFIAIGGFLGYLFMEWLLK